MKKMYKVMLLVLCAALLIAGSVMGTLAYLKDTKSVTNTFTVGKVEITLDEAKILRDIVAPELSIDVLFDSEAV
jgi:predicted ribosomally synthesized peptide with SipW-like signal peptide